MCNIMEDVMNRKKKVKRRRLIIVIVFCITGFDTSSYV